MITSTSTGYTLNGTAVFSCGCGNLTPKIRRIMRSAGCGEVPVIVTSNNVESRKYIKQERLDGYIPALKSRKHGVLYNPSTKRFIDIYGASKGDLAKLYENIAEVVHGY